MFGQDPFYHQYCNTSTHDGMEAAAYCPSACGCVPDCEGVWGGPKVLDPSGRCVCRQELLDSCGVCDRNASNDNACCPADDPGWRGSSYGHCSDYAVGQYYHQYCNTSSEDGMEAAIHCPRACGCVPDCEGVLGGPKVLDTSGQCVCRQWLLDSCGVCDIDSSNDNACCPADDPSWRGCWRITTEIDRYTYHQLCNTLSSNGVMEAAIHCPTACGCVRDCEGVSRARADPYAGIRCSDYAIGHPYHQYCNTSSHDGMYAAIYCPLACGHMLDCEGVCGGLKALDGNGRCVCRPDLLDSCGVCDTNSSNDNACCPADDPSWQGSSYGNGCSDYYIIYHQYCNTSSYDGMEAAIHCPSACGCVQDCEGVWGGLKALDGNGQCVCPPQFDHCGVCDGDASNDNACCPADDPSWQGSSGHGHGCSDPLSCNLGCSDYAIGQSYHQYCNTPRYDGMEAAIHCPSSCGCVRGCDGIWSVSAHVLDNNGQCVCQPQFDHCGVCDLNIDNDNVCCHDYTDDYLGWRASSFPNYRCSHYAIGQSFHQYCNTSTYDGMEAAIYCASACGCVQDCEGVWGGPKALDGNGHCVCQSADLLDSCGVCDLNASNDNACCPADDPGWRSSRDSFSCSAYALGQSFHQYCNTSSRDRYGRSLDGMEAAIHCPSACGCVQDCEGVWGGLKAL
eukprot:COSAG01_NODE_10843_length_2069_cov_2.689340_1_plen_674_part_01